MTADLRSGGSLDTAMHTERTPREDKGREGGATEHQRLGAWDPRSERRGMDSASQPSEEPNGPTCGLLIPRTVRH